MDKKKRILHICNLGMNGKAVFVANLLTHTDFNKYDVSILNYRNEYAAPVFEKLEKLEVKVINPDRPGLLNFLRLIKRECKQNKYDVVHSHVWDLSVLFLLVARICGVKIRVIHSHNTSKAAGRYNALKSFVRDKILWKLMQLVMPFAANRFAACSDEAAEWLFPSCVVKKKKYSFIINGIDLDRFVCDRKPVDKNNVKVLFAGRMIYQKNPLFAVEAFYHFWKKISTSHLTMIGSGVMLKQVKDKIRELGISDFVTIVEQTNDMPKYYKESDIFLFPSVYEGLGIVLVEAQTAGLKCISSDTVPLSSQCGMVMYKPLNQAFTWGGVFV